MERVFLLWGVTLLPMELVPECRDHRSVTRGYGLVNRLVPRTAGKLSYCR